jgi:hypothetical protein
LCGSIQAFGADSIHPISNRWAPARLTFAMREILHPHHRAKWHEAPLNYGASAPSKQHMHDATPPFKCRVPRPRRQLLVALTACVLLPACAAPPTADPMPTPPLQTEPGADAIDQISMETDCNGCPQGSRLELRRDGPAVLTHTGKGRLGTTDHVAQADMPPGEFDVLARQLVELGYFGLADTYEEAGLMDGRWTQLSVARGGRVKQVFRREDAGPAALKQLERAISALQDRLRFVPIGSGQR